MIIEAVEEQIIAFGFNIAINRQQGEGKNWYQAFREIVLAGNQAREFEAFIYNLG